MHYMLGHGLSQYGILQCKFSILHGHHLGNQAVSLSSSNTLNSFSSKWFDDFLPVLHIMESAAGLASVNMSRCQRPALVYTYTHTQKETLALRASLSIQVPVNISVQ